MKGVILDANSLGEIDLSPITSTLEDWLIYPSTKPSETGARIIDADIVLSNKVELFEAELKQAKKLKFISLLATGTNNLDINFARSLNIQSSNARAYATPSVVEHTISLMLCLSRNTLNYVADTKSGRWQESDIFCRLDHPISQLSGKTLGIIGMGELGKNVALIAKAFGMKVIDSRKTETEMFFSSADYISLHCPLNTETKHIINKGTLSLMKSTAYIINTARGGLINSEDLVHALKNDVISGAGIDVLNTEPPTKDEALIQASDLKNLIVTPHNAWGTVEARNCLIQQTRENILGFLAGNPLRVI